MNDMRAFIQDNAQDGEIYNILAAHGLSTPARPARDALNLLSELIGLWPTHERESWLHDFNQALEFSRDDHMNKLEWSQALIIAVAMSVMNEDEREQAKELILDRLWNNRPLLAARKMYLDVADMREKAIAGNTDTQRRDNTASVMLDFVKASSDTRFLFILTALRHTSWARGQLENHRNGIGIQEQLDKVMDEVRPFEFLFLASFGRVEPNEARMVRQVAQNRQVAWEIARQIQPRLVEANTTNVIPLFVAK